MPNASQPQHRLQYFLFFYQLPKIKKCFKCP